MSHFITKIKLNKQILHRKFYTKSIWDIVSLIKICCKNFIQLRHIIIRSYLVNLFLCLKLEIPRYSPGFQIVMCKHSTETLGRADRAVGSPTPSWLGIAPSLSKVYYYYTNP